MKHEIVLTIECLTDKWEEHCTLLLWTYHAGIYLTNIIKKLNEEEEIVASPAKKLNFSHYKTCLGSLFAGYVLFDKGGLALEVIDVYSEKTLLSI